MKSGVMVLQSVESDNPEGIKKMIANTIIINLIVGLSVSLFSRASSRSPSPNTNPKKHSGNDLLTLN